MLSSFLLILLACAAYGALHSLLASYRAKDFAARRLGALGGRYYRLFFNLAAVVTFLPVLYLAWRLPDARIYAIPMPWVLLSLAVQAAAGCLLLAGLRQTSAATFLGLDALLPGADADTTTAPPRFVTTGLYRWVRHPLYTCGLVIIWLSPIMTWNLLALFLGLTGYVIIGIYYEERKLRREFGPAYDEYRRQVPALIPRIPPRKNGTRNNAEKHGSKKT